MRWLQSTPYSFVFVMDLIPRLEKGLQWWTWRVTKWPTNRWHCLWPGQEVFSKVPKGSLLARVVSLMFSKGVNQHLSGWRSPGLRAIHLTETRRISRVKLCTFQQLRAWTHRADLEEQSWAGGVGPQSPPGRVPPSQALTKRGVCLEETPRTEESGQKLEVVKIRRSLRETQVSSYVWRADLQKRDWYRSDYGPLLPHPRVETLTPLPQDMTIFGNKVVVGWN